MILRGDGKSGVIKDNCFAKSTYPNEEVDFVLMNPPFPHKKTDTPATEFIDRGLKSIKKRGILASIVPYSLLVKTNEWHKKILKNNTLYFIATLPFDVFQPYATYDTAILMIQKGIPHDHKKVFMARVFNDGFKVKKKNRIEREGNQIPRIIDAFNSKNEIAELTAFPIITTDSEEWTPENYIENELYTDTDFILGLEESIQKQASFYIMNGSRIIGHKRGITAQPILIDSSLFSENTSITINKNDLDEILISDYFDVMLGGNDEIEDLEEGNFPIVSTSEFMNGVSTWKKPNKIYPAPSISVATDGSVCSSFVQEFPYYAFYKVAILTQKKNYQHIDIDSFYYFAYLLSRERWRYVYARKFGKERINKTKAFPIIKFFRDSIESVTF